MVISIVIFIFCCVLLLLLLIVAIGYRLYCVWIIFILMYLIFTLNGVFKQALPFLNDNASIIFTTTVAAKKGMAGASIYAASKAAIHALTKIFAAELVGRGIRVNAVSPGPIETPIFDKMGALDEDKKEMKAGIVAGVPMKRMGTPEEVAKTVAFLASDDASFITGVEIDVDGGMGQL